MPTIVQANQINYTDVTPLSNGPIAPPNLLSTVPYSTVVHETPIMEQYSLVQQYQSSNSIHGPSNEEYSYDSSITIVRTSVNASTASKCVTRIYTSNYNVTFYDMDYNNVPYTTEYAVKLTNLSVIGLTHLVLLHLPHQVCLQ